MREAYRLLQKSIILVESEDIELEENEEVLYIYIYPWIDKKCGVDIMLVLEWLDDYVYDYLCDYDYIGYESINGNFQWE